MIRKLLFGILLAIFVFSMIGVGDALWERYKEVQVTKQSQQYVDMDPSLDLSDPTLDPSIALQVDEDALRALNPDYVGYLIVPGTNISYPIVQGRDNAFYLNHGFDKRALEVGSIFMDYRNDAAFTNSHTIVYGHHTQQNTMFSHLKKYEEELFFESHPFFFLYIQGTLYRIEVAHFAIVESNEFIYNPTITKEESASFFAQSKLSSLWDRGLQWQEQDQLITLSTCVTYQSKKRYVLQGILQGKK